jgi:hypothetical protein
MRGLESSKLPEASVEPFSGAHLGRKRNKRQVLENPKEVHRIEPGTLRGDVLDGLGLKHMSARSS